jgi:hypothetical protein
MSKELFDCDSVINSSIWRCQHEVFLLRLAYCHIIAYSHELAATSLHTATNFICQSLAFGIVLFLTVFKDTKVCNPLVFKDMQPPQDTLEQGKGGVYDHEAYEAIFFFCYVNTSHRHRFCTYIYY